MRAVYTHALRPGALIQIVGPEARPENTMVRLKRAIRLAKESGITNVPLKTLILDILWPMVSIAGVALTLPYVITKGVLPRLPWITVEFVEAAYMHAWWIELMLCVLISVSIQLWGVFQKYRASLRDTLYLERRELVSLADARA